MRYSPVIVILQYPFLGDTKKFVLTDEIQEQLTEFRKTKITV